MKTYKGKTISKAEIQRIIRTQDPTQIYRLVNIVEGGKVEQRRVIEFVKKYAPTKYLYHCAFSIACGARLRRLFSRSMTSVDATIVYEEMNKRHVVMNYFRQQLREPLSTYTKIPVMGITGLYACSPWYGHYDRNKHRMIDIDGNQRFCELLCMLFAKHFPEFYPQLSITLE